MSLHTLRTTIIFLEIYKNKISNLSLVFWKILHYKIQRNKQL